MASRSRSSSVQPVRHGSDHYAGGTRERHRSPDRRRERRRSRSPAMIDRYQPDRSSRDDYRSARAYDEPRRRRSSPERGHGAIDRYVPGQEPPPQDLRNPLPDPMTLEIQVGFAWYSEWWRGEQHIKREKDRAKGIRPRLKSDREAREEKAAERGKIQAAYDQYKEKLQKQQAATFVRLHQSEDWFRERYAPEVRNAFRAKLAEFRKELYAQFEIDLAQGVFDDFTLEGIYKSESNGLGGILEKEEGETVAAAEILQTGDLLPVLGGDLRDPMSLQPTLLLKTIAPTVTRTKLEEFAKEHLGEENGGFRHLSLSDPNPLKKCHRMGWIILKHNSSESEEQTMADAPKDNKSDDDMKLEDDEAGAEDAPASEPKTTAERALVQINGKTVEDLDKGGFTVHCGVHRPPDAPRKKALWDLYSAPERIRKDLELATRLVRKFDNELGDECFGTAKIEERVNYLQDNGKLKAERPSKGAADFDIMDEIEEGEEEGMIPEDDEFDDDELLVLKKKLDLQVEYLRRVYNFCFFCVFESDSVHELQRKCPGGHLRRPRASLTTAAKEIARASAAGEPYPLKRNGTGKTDADDDMDLTAPESPSDERNKFSQPNAKLAQQLQRAWNWVKTMEEKILQLLEPENVDLKKIGGVPVEEAVDEELKKFVQQEDTNKYRCLIDCKKLFKGMEFWHKHVKTRHADFRATIESKVQLINSYVLDPSHIAPSRSDANSNGHFPIGNSGMPTGTPRNFSLQSHMSAGFAPGLAASYPALMAAGGWPGAAMANVPGLGPIRTQAGRGLGTSYRSNGPYARPPLPPGRAPSFSGRSALGLPEGGAGPREATQGRTIRTYEDLDAPTTNETELDY